MLSKNSIQTAAFPAYRFKMVGKLVVFSLLWVSVAAAAEPVKNLKLVVAIVVDQFRYDYLTRYKGEYKAGLARLMDRGAYFTNAYYQHFPTVTAVGHSVIMSGAMPSVSGIVGNDWYDRSAGKRVTSVGDDTVKVLGGGRRFWKLKLPAAPKGAP